MIQIDIAGLSEAEVYERIADGVRAAFVAALKEKRTPITFDCKVHCYMNGRQFDTAIINATARGWLEESNGFVRPPNRHD